MRIICPLLDLDLGLEIQRRLSLLNSVIPLQSVYIWFINTKLIYFIAKFSGVASVTVPRSA